MSWFDQEQWPAGLRCRECHRPFENGDWIVERAFDDESSGEAAFPVTFAELVCVSCGTRLTSNVSALVFEQEDGTEVHAFPNAIEDQTVAMNPNLKRNMVAVIGMAFAFAIVLSNIVDAMIRSLARSIARID